jgi:hypothetical protein
MTWAPNKKTITHNELWSSMQRIRGKAGGVSFRASPRWHTGSKCLPFSTLQVCSGLLLFPFPRYPKDGNDDSIRNQMSWLLTEEVFLRPNPTLLLPTLVGLLHWCPYSTTPPKLAPFPAGCLLSVWKRNGPRTHHEASEHHWEPKTNDRVCEEGHDWWLDWVVPLRQPENQGPP